MTPLIVFFSVALAGSCPDVAVIESETPYDAGRTWLHEPGWFTPLDKPDSAVLANEIYSDDTPVLVLHLGKFARAWPISAMAYHHVANDYVGDESVVVTY